MTREKRIRFVLQKARNKEHYEALKQKERDIGSCFFSQIYYVPAPYGFKLNDEQKWVERVVTVMAKSRKMTAHPKRIRANKYHVWMLRFRQSRIFVERHGDRAYMVRMSRDMSRWARFIVLQELYKNREFVWELAKLCNSERQLGYVSLFWKRFLDEGRKKNFVEFAEQQTEYKFLKKAIRRRKRQWKWKKG